MRRLLASESGKACLSEGRPPTPFPTSQGGAYRRSGGRDKHGAVATSLDLAKGG